MDATRSGASSSSPLVAPQSEPPGDRRAADEGSEPAALEGEAQNKAACNLPQEHLQGERHHEAEGLSLKESGDRLREEREGNQGTRQDARQQFAQPVNGRDVFE